VNALLNFQTGKKTAWITLLIGLIFAIIAFGPLSLSESNTTPSSGLKDSVESVQVQKFQESLPVNEGSLALVVYTSETKFTDDQLSWLQGEFDPQAQMPVGGANEKFTEFTNVDVMGEKFCSAGPDL